MLNVKFFFKYLCMYRYIYKSIILLFSIQTNSDNMHTFVNMNTERAENEVILLIQAYIMHTTYITPYNIHI